MNHGARSIPYLQAPRPSSNEIWIGDVGWNIWEKIGRIRHTGDLVVENFGWPCYEGVGKQPAYGDGANLCQTRYASVGTATDPYFTYSHSDTVVASESCPPGSSSIAGIAFYGTGSYPALYDGALFFADYSRNCIWTPATGTCAHPIALPAGGGTFTDTTLGGSNALAGSCATSSNAPERVFAWTPATSGHATVSTCGADLTSYDTVLYVRAATCAAPDLACNDDATGCDTGAGPQHGSRVMLDVSAGATYLIVVDGYNGHAGGFTLSVAPPP